MDLFLESLSHASFWAAVGQIILIDILLGGDNAVVIALACRELPANLRLKGIVWGTVGAIVLRVALIFFALTLLQIPYLKLVGAVLLVWIGVKLLAQHDATEQHEVAASERLWSAIKTIVVADLVMSIDNVVAVASAAEGAHSAAKMPLVVFGLLVSIPIIVGGSQLVLRLMDRWPIIITLGGLLLGYIAGAMAITDHAWGQDNLTAWASWKWLAGAAGALLVLMWSRLLARPTQPTPKKLANRFEVR